MLPKLSAYGRDFDETDMSFLIKDNKLLEKYDIWNKTSNTSKTLFGSEPVCKKISKN